VLVLVWQLVGAKQKSQHESDTYGLQENMLGGSLHRSAVKSTRKSWATLPRFDPAT